MDPSIFNDVIGPVMRGPSSSHCAAALRIGSLARDLAADELNEVIVEFDRHGSLLVHVRDEAAAAEQCRMAARALPCSYQSHLLLGLSLERLDCWDEAAVHLSKAVQRKPTSAEANYHLGVAYQSQGRTDDSIACLSPVSALQPKNAKAYMNLAVALSGRGETERAVRTLREGTRSIPHDPVLHFNLSR